MIFVFHQVFVLFDVVEDVTQTHLCFGSLLLHLFMFLEGFILMELLLNSDKQFEPILGWIKLHVFKEKAVDHQCR